MSDQTQSKPLPLDYQSPQRNPRARGWWGRLVLKLLSAYFLASPMTLPFMDSWWVGELPPLAVARLHACTAVRAGARLRDRAGNRAHRAASHEADHWIIAPVDLDHRSDSGDRFRVHNVVRGWTWSDDLLNTRRHCCASRPLDTITSSHSRSLHASRHPSAQPPVV
jgi:hypothetical protein